MTQLVDYVGHRSNAGGIIGGGLSTVGGEPALQLTDRNTQQLGERLLRDAQHFGGSDQHVANGSVVVVGTIIGDVAQDVTELFKRDTDISSLFGAVVVAKSLVG